MEEIEKEGKSRGEIFVNFVLVRMVKDSAYGAALRRADNPATETQAWEYLARWCDIDKEWERRSFSIIAAALSRAKPNSDGNLSIGKALCMCYKDDGGNQSEPAKARLRRLLACDSAQEACEILRPLLGFIASKSVPLAYGQLLNDLLYFGNGEKVKVRWAVDFYGRRGHDSVSA